MNQKIKLEPRPQPPKYLCSTASHPYMAFADARRNRPEVRWQVHSMNTGRTLMASEWLPDTPMSREWCERQIKAVTKEQREKRGW